MNLSIWNAVNHCHFSAFHRCKSHVRSGEIKTKYGIKYRTHLKGLVKPLKYNTIPCLCCFAMWLMLNITLIWWSEALVMKYHNVFFTQYIMYIIKVPLWMKADGIFTWRKTTVSIIKIKVSLPPHSDVAASFAKHSSKSCKPGEIAYTCSYAYKSKEYE